MKYYCKHLKKRKNKPYCNLLKKEITLSLCQECVNKEYRFPVKRKIVKSNSHQMKKSPLMSGKSPLKSGKYTTLSNKNTQKNKKNGILSTKIAKNAQKMKNKSKKLAKIEKNRFSVFTNDLEKCFLCDSKKEELHEIFAGRNRINSMKYGFVLPLCHECHSLNQNNPFFNEFWHKNGQEYWECNIGSRDEFIKVFRKNYLD